MKEPVIEYITCESGDWYVLKEFGQLIYEGHSVPDHVWLALLENFVGYESLKITALSDEEMQSGIYK